MNEIERILKKHNLHPKSYRKNKKTTIIETLDNKYVVKLNANNYDIYNYLNSRDFNYYPPNYNNSNDNYDLSLYVDDYSIPSTQRMEDLVKTLAVLHHKTSYYQEVDLNDIKEIYENNKNELLELLKYYQELNDIIDSHVFMSPSEYLLVRNISLFYYMTNYSLRKFDEWYKMMDNKTSWRISLIHNNVSVEHMLINENRYLISWDKARNDIPIKDLISFYKQYYASINLSDLLNMYECHNVLSEEEKCLMFAILSIPKKISWTKDNLNDTMTINDEIFYLNKVYEYIKNDKAT